jgi:four helix bundle protein
MSNFTELKVWQKARALAGEVYAATRSFPRQEMFGLTQQMRRAAISVVSNLAEGHARYTHADYASFVVIARGSTAELEAQVIIAHDLQYIDETTRESLSSKAEEIAKMLNALINYLRS